MMKLKPNLVFTSISRFIDLTLTLATIFYLLGFLSDQIIAMAIGVNKISLSLNNIGGFSLILLVFILYKIGKISSNTALIAQTIIVVLKLYFYFIYKIVNPFSSPDMYIIASACVLIIPTALANLTSWRFLSFAIATLTIIFYIIIAFVLRNTELIESIPTVAFTLVGISTAFLYS